MYPILLFLAFSVPLFVLPGYLVNAFSAPKNLLIISSVCLMVGLYVNSRERPQGRTTVRISLFLLVLVNLFSLFYTLNPYYTARAAVLNISCLAVFYFSSLYLNEKRIFWLFVTITLSGVFVSVETWLEFFNRFYLFPWMQPGDMVPGTIGNPNYLGAYLIFPLFSAAGLIFVMQKKWKFLFVFFFLVILGAFLFSRARASWLGFFIAIPLLIYLIRPKRVIVLACIFLALATYALVEQHRPHGGTRDSIGIFQVLELRTLKLRVYKYWRPSIWLIKRHLVFGSGLWSYRNQVYPAQEAISKEDPDFFKNYPAPKPRRAHSDYLEIINDAGVVGAAVLLIFFVAVMRNGWRGAKSSMLVACAYCSVVGIMGAAMFFFPFRVNVTLLMTSLMMGVLENASNTLSGASDRCGVVHGGQATPS